MTVLTLHHGGRTVQDMEQALAFYRDLLGLRVVDDDVQEGPELSELVGIKDARLRIVFLSPDGKPPYVELIQYLKGAGRLPDGSETAGDVGNTHCCLLVDDIHKVQEELMAAGVRFSGPPVLDTAYFKGEYCTYCYDPDGFVVELWSRPVQ
jgi:catechol 2,3-dioxygenase-like lactoylglutathione lyase family enzyme